MPDFVMVSARQDAPVTGLIAFGDGQHQLHRKINGRASHYATLLIATGEGWTALLGDQDAELPWLGTPPIYLYSPGPGWFCQNGYQPNVPASLYDHLATRLRRQFDLTGPFALIADHPTGQLFDFGHAQPLREVDLTASAITA